MKESDFAKIALPKWQKENPTARVFRNNTGMAWQGMIQSLHGLGKKILANIRPIFFGVGLPVKDKKNGRTVQKGGGDYIGWTTKTLCEICRKYGHPCRLDKVRPEECLKCDLSVKIAIFTNLETKSKTGKESPEQIKFRKLVQESGGISIVLKEGEE